MEKSLEQDIIDFSKVLRLPTFRKHYREIAEEAARDNLSFEEYLHSLLRMEYEILLENRRKAQIRQAGFSQWSETDSCR